MNPTLPCPVTVATMTTMLPAQEKQEAAGAIAIMLEK